MQHDFLNKHFLRSSQLDIKRIFQCSLLVFFLPLFVGAIKIYLEFIFKKIFHERTESGSVPSIFLLLYEHLKFSTTIPATYILIRHFAMCVMSLQTIEIDSRNIKQRKNNLEEKIRKVKLTLNQNTHNNNNK